METVYLNWSTEKSRIDRYLPLFKRKILYYHMPTDCFKHETHLVAVAASTEMVAVAGLGKNEKKKSETRRNSFTFSEGPRRPEPVRKENEPN